MQSHSVANLRLPTFSLSLPLTSAPSIFSLPQALPSSSSTTTTTSSTPTIPCVMPLPPTQLPSYVTSKVPTLPKKLLDSILAWEYIDLADLLPEQLSAITPDTGRDQIVVLPESSWDTRRRKKRQIPDLATWVEVFTTYLLVLSSRFPETLRDLISYQLFIVKHSKRFRYPSWLFYDVEYRKWAAVNHIKNWSITNPELYSLAFTGQALAINWCPICQVEGGNHTYDCPQMRTQFPSSIVPAPQHAGALPQRRVAANPADPPAK